jgi:cobaltochelatase CobN
MPLGLHTFGVELEGEKLVAMVKSILRDDFIDDIYNVIPKGAGDEEDWENEANAYAIELLNATLLNGTDVVSAQDDILGFNDSSITDDFNLALEYSSLIGQTSRETNAEYIEPGPGNDPIRNPEALPTGRNFYSFDQRRFPDEENEQLGSMLAEQMLESYKATHNGTYPEKVSYILWSVETMRHHGLMEAQIYALLGVKPHRDDLGSIDDLEVIPLEDLGRPRIDVVLLPSGLYRDTFPFQLQMMDRAVRMVADLDETNETNYIRWNSLKMEAVLIGMEYDNETAQYLSRSRIFTQPPGAYGTGMSESIAASETWGDESKLADLYISRMANIYGEDMWGDHFEEVLRMNLVDIDAAVHSDTSNIFGVIDNDDFYSEFGALGMVVRALTGTTPDMYIADLQNVDNLHMTTLEEVYRTELRARYFNPKWIEGMMEYDYAGAREFMKFTEYMWGWDATLPEMVTDNNWNMVYEVYVKDKYDLGLEEFFKENPYQYQSMTARMLETIRKDYWSASDEVIQNLVREYVESVAENGVTCCHHTCGNPLLDEYISGMLSVPDLSAEDAEEYRQLMDEATGRQQPATKTVVDDSSSGAWRRLQKIRAANESTDTGSGAGMDAELLQDAGAGDEGVSNPSDYVEGYEMQDESAQPSDAGPISFSGADLLGMMLVVLAAGAIYIGFRKRGV